MTKPKTPAQMGEKGQVIKNIPNPDDEEAIAEAKRKNSVFGFFQKKRKRGRKWNQQLTEENKNNETAVIKRKDPPNKEEETQLKKPKPKSTSTLVNWTNHHHILQKYIDADRNGTGRASVIEWRRRTKCGEKWFRHITNNVATKHWAKSTKPLLPSTYLDCAIDQDQVSFLNPSMRDVILATLEEDAYSEKSKKKRAQRRMDILDGNAKSYAKFLNLAERMEKYADYNQLTALIASMKLERKEEKKKRKERKTENEAEKERKKQEVEEKEKEMKDSLMPFLEEEVSKGYDYIKERTVPELMNILYYYFDVKKVEGKTVKGLRRHLLIELIEERMKSLTTPMNDSNLKQVVKVKK